MAYNIPAQMSKSMDMKIWIKEKEKIVSIIDCVTSTSRDFKKDLVHSYLVHCQQVNKYFAKNYSQQLCHTT